MPQDPTARQDLIEVLGRWLLEIHNLHVQAYIQKMVLPPAQQVVPSITDIAWQFRANGERKLIVFLNDGKTKAFDTPQSVADWLAKEQQEKDAKEMALARKAG